MRKTVLFALASVLTLIPGLFTAANSAMAGTHNHSAIASRRATNDLKDGSCGAIGLTNSGSSASYVRSNGNDAPVSLGGEISEWCVSVLPNGFIKFHHRVNGTASGNVLEDLAGDVYLEPNSSGNAGQKWAMGGSTGGEDWISAVNLDSVYTNGPQSKRRSPYR